MKTPEKSRELARLMVDIGKAAGRKMLALITDMDCPLGNAVGNSLEVIEAINTLRGNGPEDFTELCVTLASHMLALADYGDYEDCENRVKRVLADGSALEKFVDMTEGQGGDVSWIRNVDKFPKAKYSCSVTSSRSGFIYAMDAEGYGTASLMLGAGRNRIEDKIDYTAGLILNKKPGDKVEKGEIIATLYSSAVKDFGAAAEKILLSTTISDAAPEKRPLVWDVIR